MLHFYSAAALALLSIPSVFAQDCPVGSEPVQKPDWQNCGLTNTDAKTNQYVSQLQCASIDVPADYTNRAAGTIPLRLIRFPAANSPDTAKSIVTNPGGPGSSGFEYIIGGGGTSVQMRAGTGFNVVSFDPRGAAGLTTPGTCKDNPFTFGINDYEDQSTKFAAAAKTCDTQDPNMPLYNTPFTARDVKAVSESTNSDGLIRYWGFSYGTALGATVAAMFPDRIERMILDGNVHANEYYRGQLLNAVRDVDAAVANFFRLCFEAGINAATNTPYCAVYETGKTAQQLQDRYDTYRLSLDPGPRSTLDNEFFKALYFGFNFKAFATSLLQKYNAAGKRAIDFNPLQYQIDTAPDARNEIACTDNQYRGHTSPADFQAIDKAVSYSKYGAVSGSANPKNCLPWIPRPKELFQLPFSNIQTRWPLLILNTIYDPATPVNGAQYNQGAFQGAALITTSELGHCVFQQEAVGLTQIVFNYFNTNVKPSSIAQPLPPAANTNPFVTGGNNMFTPPDQPPNMDDTATGSTTTTASTLSTTTSATVLTTTSAIGSTTIDIVTSTTTSVATATVKLRYVRREMKEMFEKRDLEMRQLSTTLPVITTTLSVATSLPITLTSTTSGFSCTPDPYITSTTTTTSTMTATSTTTSAATSTATGTTTGSAPGTSTGPASGTTTGTTTYTNSATSITTTSASSISTIGGITTSSGQLYSSTWTSGTWYGPTTAKPVTQSWSTWSAKKPDPATWSQWNTQWTEYKSQPDCVPYTKTVTKDGKPYVTVYAVPTVTVYVDYVQDVCPTGIYTNTITVTATCNKGCYEKPTGVPMGYTTTEVYCSVCATPATVTATVKATVAVESWSTVNGVASPTWSTMAGLKPTETWSVVGKYTGAAQVNAVPVVGLVPALLFGLLWL